MTFLLCAAIGENRRRLEVNAVRLNGGSTDMTAQQFTQKWVDKFDGAGGSTPVNTAPTAPGNFQYERMDPREALMLRNLAAADDPLRDRQPRPAGSVRARRGRQAPGWRQSRSRQRAGGSAHAARGVPLGIACAESLLAPSAGEVAAAKNVAAGAPSQSQHLTETLARLLARGAGTAASAQ